MPNKALWNLNADGAFTVSSSWNMIREQRTQTPINRFTWHKHIPFKCSFLLWRALRETLPTNEKLQQFGQDPKDCYCCNNPGLDIVEHIFNLGHFVNYLWKYVVASYGISRDPLPLHHYIIR